MKDEEPEYIETPYNGFVGGSDKIIWPYFAVFISVGSFLAAMYL
jgi:hypothetical protein